MTNIDWNDTLFVGGYGVSGVGATEAIAQIQGHEDTKFYLMAGYFIVSTLVILIKQVAIPLIDKLNQTQKN